MVFVDKVDIEFIDYLNHNFKIMELGYCYCIKCLLGPVYFNNINDFCPYTIEKINSKFELVKLTCEEIIIKNIIE